jgi:plasmid stabilization system protein ParE
VEVEYHPLVRRDIAEILEWYDARSDTAGDRFFAEFESTVEGLLSGHLRGYPIDQFSMKIPMRRFPYLISYECTGETLFIFVVKHRRRHPSVGMRRQRPSKG